MNNQEHIHDDDVITDHKKETGLEMTVRRQGKEICQIRRKFCKKKQF